MILITNPPKNKKAKIPNESTAEQKVLLLLFSEQNPSFLENP
jgi:hypothetical protein